MLRKRSVQPVQPEPVDPPPEMPVVARPDPVVRTVLVGPQEQAQTVLSDLISRSSGLEVLDRFDRADEAVSSLHNLPARRMVAVLIDAKLSGPHDAGWLIRHLRERHPVFRLFAYAGGGDEAAMEHVALSGVDEVLVVEGADADQEILDAFDRQFDLHPVPEEPAVAVDAAAEPAPDEDVAVATRVPTPIETFVAGPVEPPPPPPPVVQPPPPAAIEPPPRPAATQPPPPPAATEPPPPDAAPTLPREPSVGHKRGLFHKRSGSAPRNGTVEEPEESAALRNLERELAGVRNLTPEESRVAAARRARPSSEKAEEDTGDVEGGEPPES